MGAILSQGQHVKQQVHAGTHTQFPEGVIMVSSLNWHWQQSVNLGPAGDGKHWGQYKLGSEGHFDVH